MIEITNYNSSEISLQNSNASENLKKENEFSNLFIKKINEPEISLSTLLYPVESVPKTEIESELLVVDEEGEKSDFEDNRETSNEDSTDQLLSSSSNSMSLLLSQEDLTKVNLASKKKNTFNELKEEDNIINLEKKLNDVEKKLPKAELNFEIEQLIQIDEKFSTLKDIDLNEAFKTINKKDPQIEKLINKDVTVNLLDEKFETNQDVSSDEKDLRQQELQPKKLMILKDLISNEEKLNFEEEKDKSSQLVKFNEIVPKKNEIIEDDGRQILKMELDSSDTNVNKRTFDLKDNLILPLDSKEEVSVKDDSNNKFDRAFKSEADNLINPINIDSYEEVELKTNFADKNILEDKQHSLPVNSYLLENPTIKDSDIKMNQEPVSNKVNSDQPLFEKDNLSKIINSFNEEKVNFKHNGTQTFKISLQPDKLGDLEILLDVKDGKISAKFLVESEKVRELIKSSLPNLQEGLMKQNMVVSKAEVSLQTAHNNFQFNGDLNHRQQHQEKMSKSSKLSQQYEKTFDYQDVIEEKQIDSVDILV